MSMTLLRRLGLALAGAGVAFALVACGGGGDGDGGGGDASVRLLNVTNDIAALDLYSEEDDEEAVRSEGVGRDAVGDYFSLKADTYNFLVKRAGADATLLQQTSRSVSGGNKYTVIAYGYEGAYKSALLSENEDDSPASGKTKIRVLNLSADAGNLDIYVTDADTPLSDASPVIASLDGGSVSAYATVTSGNRRIRVTAAGDNADLRLDIPAATLESTGIVNVVLTPGNGGVLVHGYLMPQGGDLTLAKNTQSRVRLVSSVTSTGSVGAAVNGTTLATAQSSPSVGGYANVTAGALTGTFTVNGVAITTPTATLVAGNDYSLMVAGDPGASSVYVIGDDNRLPTTTKKAKFRLFNGVPTETAGLSLQVNLNPLADGVAFGAASTATQVDAAADSTIEVNSGLGSTVYSRTDQDIAEQGVYSVFLLAGNPAGSTGLLRKER
ncbi:DUF4397 domain-containing protein [Caldimonas sp. KR1-144]|uniref:DUF4397 domain-containing protein n=1 Tax=Caldimonas sp. KR1-144 TaxID=3400911 RepID=UPI003C0C69A7